MVMGGVKLEDVWQSTDMGESEGGRYLRYLLSTGTGSKLNYSHRDVVTLPPWYCRAKYQKGLQFYRANVHSVLFSNLIGLVMVLAVESILFKLICTNKSSTPKAAYRRYVDTMFLVIDFYESLPEHEDSRCIRSISKVRRMHLLSSAKLEQSGNGFINQRDMVITQFGFMGYIMICPEKLGISAKPDQLDGLVHMWRVLGYMLGIDDKLNLCAEDWETTRERTNLMMKHVTRPILANVPIQFEPMYRNLISGLRYLMPIIDHQTIYFYTMYLTNVPGYFCTDHDRDSQRAILDEFPQYFPRVTPAYLQLHVEEEHHINRLSTRRRLKLKAMVYIHEILFHGNSLWRRIFNQLLRLKLFQIRVLPLGAIWDFGYRYATVSQCSKTSCGGGG